MRQTIDRLGRVTMPFGRDQSLPIANSIATRSSSDGLPLMLWITTVGARFDTAFVAWSLIAERCRAYGLDDPSLCYPTN